METINVAELLEANKAVITEKLVKDFANDVARSIGYTLQSEIQKHAEAYIKDNVLPEVQRLLEAEKDVLVKAILVAVKTGVDVLGMKMVEQVQKNLQNSWNVSDIAKKIIGSGY